MSAKSWTITTLSWPFAAHGAVLVLAEPAEVAGLAVDQELRAVDLQGPDAHQERVRVGRRVAVAPQLDRQVVEVALARPPWVHRPRPSGHRSGRSHARPLRRRRRAWRRAPP